MRSSIDFLLPARLIFMMHFSLQTAESLFDLVSMLACYSLLQRVRIKENKIHSVILFILAGKREAGRKIN
jgi:hypothetical protein